MELSFPTELETLPPEERKKREELLRKQSGGQPLAQDEIDFRKKMHERATHAVTDGVGPSGKAN